MATIQIQVGNEQVSCGDVYWETAKNVARAAVRYMRTVSQQDNDDYDDVPIRGAVFTGVLDELTPAFTYLAMYYGRPQVEVAEQLQLLVADGALFRTLAAA